MQRTNILLISIAIIFCISWLPLNLYNLIADISTNYDFRTQPMIVVYAICHMMGMSSACSNPVLYGWLNENFWKEFQEILCISSCNGNNATTQKFSLKNSSHRMFSTKPAKPDLVTDFQQGTTMHTDISEVNR